MKKGFTLIELLAVIVVIGVIALIVTPITLNVIEKTKLEAFKQEINSLFNAAKMYEANNDEFPNDGLNVTDKKLELKNNNFKSGRIYKNSENYFEIEFVSNGAFCAGGVIENLAIINDTCNKLDITKPIIKNVNTIVSTSSIKIIVDSEDLESGIKGYKYSNDDGITWTKLITDSNYTFDKLKSNTEYKIKVKVINNNNLEKENNSINVITKNINIPTYTISTSNWSINKTVKINYNGEGIYYFRPSIAITSDKNVNKCTNVTDGLYECETAIINSNTLLEANVWYKVDDNPTLTFNNNGYVIAQVSDGINYINGSTQMIDKVDKISPLIDIKVKVVNNQGIITIDANDYEMGTDYILLPNNEKRYIKSTYDSSGRDTSTKILVIEDKGNMVRSKLSNYFTNITYDETIDYNEIMSSNYDVIISDMHVWVTTVNNASLLNKLFDNGKNIFTSGNDTNTSLKIIKDNIGYNGTYQINKVLDNDITLKMSSSMDMISDNQQLIHFIPEVEVWYKGTVNGLEYDAIGYLEGSTGNRWIHSQKSYSGFPNDQYARVINKLSKKKTTTYTVTASGNYTFNVYDLAGNVVSKTVSVDLTPPLVDFVTKTSSITDVKYSYNAVDSESGIKNVSCYYGDSTTNVNTLGTISDNSCVFPNNVEYAKVCATNGMGITTCSATTQMAKYLIKKGNMIVPFSTYQASLTKINSYLELDISGTDPNRRGMYTTSTYNYKNYMQAYIDCDMDIKNGSVNPNFELTLSNIIDLPTNTSNYIWYKGIPIFTKIGVSNYSEYIPRKTYMSPINNLDKEAVVTIRRNKSGITEIKSKIFNVWFQ